MKRQLTGDDRITRKEVLEYMREQGQESAYNLLLLGGPDFYDGDYDEYNELLESLDPEKGDAALIGLASLITDACFHYDPYNGADYEDVLEATEEGLKDPDRMRDMLEELARMLLDM